MSVMVGKFAEMETGEPVADAARRRLAESPYRSIQRLRCAFDGQNLTLSGWLPSFYQNQLAQEAVAGLEGVGRVVNLVEVTTTETTRPS